MANPGPATASGLVRAAAERLASTSDTPRLDAEVLLRHLLGLDRTAFLARLREPVDPAVLPVFDGLVERRAAGEPVAYLTGEREFMLLPFAVGPGVLVPRPETELLVEWALGWLEARPEARVVDVATGSGAIALSIAHHLPSHRGAIVATDLSPDALAWASRNRAACGLDERVELRRGDLLEPVGEPVDLLLANLPYLTAEQVVGNPDLAAEPRLALDGGEAGLELVRRLVADAPRVLAPAGAVGLEIDPTQAGAVRDLLAAAFPGATVWTIRDLAGHDRHVIAQT